MEGQLKKRAETLARLELKIAIVNRLCSKDAVEIERIAGRMDKNRRLNLVGAFLAKAYWNARRRRNFLPSRGQDAKIAVVNFKFREIIGGIIAQRAQFRVFGGCQAEEEQPEDKYENNVPTHD